MTDTDIKLQAESYAKTDVANRGPRNADPMNDTVSEDVKLEPSKRGSVAWKEKIGRAMLGNQGHVTHGHTIGGQYSTTYHSWQAMLARCRYVERDVHAKHAARGISVCDRWLSFENFLADMGERPDGTTLDRHPNNDGDYEPGNCRWATSMEQARNRRNTRLTFEQALDVAVRRMRGESCVSIAADYGISESLPREIAKGRTWKDAHAAAMEITAND
jgi:hypothetical protein